MAFTAELPYIKGKVEIPEHLIKETLDGVPVFYKGYKDVLNKSKTSEEIMADGLLQAIIKNWLHLLLSKALDEEKYWVLVGEIGTHLSHKNNLAHDLAVFETSILTPEKIANKYADVPAKLIIEIDAEVEYGQGKTNEEYIHRKTQRVLEFGTEKVIWIFTQTHKIMVAEKGKDWVTFDWDRNVETLEKVCFNLPAFLKKKKINLPA